MYKPKTEVRGGLSLSPLHSLGENLAEQEKKGDKILVQFGFVYFIL